MLFDDECALCNGAVQFVLDHDRLNNIRFASLQSELGQSYLKKHGLPVDDFSSYVMIEGENFTIKSRAARRMAINMGGIWRSLGYIAYLIPPFIGDAFYSLIFNNRYKWFGKNTQCRLLLPEQKHRFLDMGATSFTGT